MRRGVETGLVVHVLLHFGLEGEPKETEESQNLWTKSNPSKAFGRGYGVEIPVLTMALEIAFSGHVL